MSNIDKIKGMLQAIKDNQFKMINVSLQKHYDSDTAYALTLMIEKAIYEDKIGNLSNNDDWFEFTNFYLINEHNITRAKVENISTTLLEDGIIEKNTKFQTNKKSKTTANRFTEAGIEKLMSIINNKANNFDTKKNQGNLKKTKPTDADITPQVKEKTLTLPVSPETKISTKKEAIYNIVKDIINNPKFQPTMMNFRTNYIKNYRLVLESKICMQKLMTQVATYCYENNIESNKRLNYFSEMSLKIFVKDNYDLIKQEQKVANENLTTEQCRKITSDFLRSEDGYKALRDIIFPYLKSDTCLENRIRYFKNKITKTTDDQDELNELYSSKNHQIKHIYDFTNSRRAIRLFLEELSKTQYGLNLKTIEYNIQKIDSILEPLRAYLTFVYHENIKDFLEQDHDELINYYVNSIEYIPVEEPTLLKMIMRVYDYSFGRRLQLNKFELAIKEFVNQEDSEHERMRKMAVGQEYKDYSYLLEKINN